MKVGIRRIKYDGLSVSGEEAFWFFPIYIEESMMNRLQAVNKETEDEEFENLKENCYTVIINCLRLHRTEIAEVKKDT